MNGDRPRQDRRVSRKNHVDLVCNVVMPTLNKTISAHTFKFSGTEPHAANFTPCEIQSGAKYAITKTSERYPGSAYIIVGEDRYLVLSQALTDATIEGS
jgi:hypothetical protein